MVPILLSLAGCSDGNKQKIAEMNAMIDSLEKVSADRQTDLTGLSLFIETLSDGLDSIAQQENVLFYTNKGKERTIVDRKQLKKNLEMFQNTLSTQRQRIAQLTDSLRRHGANIARLNTLVNYLNRQLDEKDKMIEQMQADLDKKNVNIAQLKERIVTLAEDNYALIEEADMHKQALIAQDNVINEAYIKIGTKKELMDVGILSGGFLKKTKVNFQNIPKDKFEKVDIRDYKEITIQSKKVKVLSQMPSSSYELKVNGDSTVLHVVDLTAFWSISNYLIIQTN
jgi:uncharacterized protein (DUF3084 family)